MTDVFWLGLGTIVATFVGPIAAVLITRIIDARRERDARRLDLFRVLMRSRKMPLSQEHVGALNLIEVEFHNVPEVINAWRALLDDFGGPPPQTPEEDARVGEKRDYLRVVLLSAMAKSLRFNIPDLQIFRGGYTPRGWADEEAELRITRRFLTEVARGKRAIPVWLERRNSTDGADGPNPQKSPPGAATRDNPGPPPNPPD